MLSRLLTGAQALFLALAAAPLGGAVAKTETLSTRYDVSLVGLPVGRASFDTQISGNAYSVDGTMKSIGLADIVSTVKGRSSVSGRIAGDRLHASRYDLDYSSDGKSFKSEVSFRSGQVASASVEPKARPHKDYIPVAPAQLRSVVDPLSGLMIKTHGGAGGLCDRTLPFFDGWSRLDLRMSSAGTKTFSTDGFSGEAIVCNVKIQPISGYKATSSGVKFITRQTLEIWFAPIRQTGIYAPVYARVPTQIGPLTFSAATFAKK